MSITKVEHLDDRVRIHYNFKQSYGPDNDIMDIEYGSIQNLPRLPQDKHGEEVFLPKCNQTVVLVPHSIREPETFSGCRSWWYDTYLK